MKHSIFAIAALCAACAFAQEATVNMVDLVRFHPNRERDRKLMKDTEKDYQAKLDKQRDRFEDLRTSYEKAVREVRNPALGDKARADAEAAAVKQRDALAAAEADLREQMQKYQKELQELDTRLLRQVTSDIRSAVEKYAKSKGIKTIGDSTVMPYADPSLDVTDEVLKNMGVDPKLRKEAAEKKAEEDAKK